MKKENNNASPLPETYINIRKKLASLEGNGQPIGKTKRREKKLENPTQVIEATLLELVNESASDTARVSAAKALMELVKYMNGENDQSAKKHEEAEKAAAVAEAKTLLAEFAELRFAMGIHAVAATAGVEQPHAVVDKRKAKPDNAAAG